MTTPPRILVLIDWFVPGYKAGGPIQSCKNIVNALSDHAEWYILTSDRDLGDTGPYEGIAQNSWQDFAPNIKVFYAVPGFLNKANFENIMKEVQPEVVYFNSMFSKNYAILPLWYLKRMAYKGPVILAPRGMLFSDAVARKGFKKKLFLQVFRSFLLNKEKMLFHATNEQERKDIYQHIGKDVAVEVIENLPNTAEAVSPREKKANELRAVCLARIHPTKNLLFTIECLQQLKTQAPVTLDVYGVMDDEPYLAECEKAIAQLPPSIRVNILPALPHQEVFSTLSQYHAFVLPTHGENFGHAIFEALSSGCPVLISDQTPWRELGQMPAGWDVTIKSPSEMIGALQQLIDMDDMEYQKWSCGARRYSLKFIKERQLKDRYLKLFSLK